MLLLNVGRYAVGESGTRRGPVHSSESPGVSGVSREQTEPHSGAVQMPIVPPRLMDGVYSDEPVVIEFSAGHGGSGTSVDDDVSVRAGHKRARINSDTVHNDVIKQSFVKRPVAFYGNLALSHLVIWSFITSSSVVTKRPHDAACLSVVSFNSIKCRVESYC